MPDTISTTVPLAAAPAKPSRVRRSAWRRFCRHRLALAGATVIGLMVVLCIVGPWLLPFDETTINVLARFAPPGLSVHVLGTDQLGRDMLARLLMAGRISLAVGFASMVLSMMVGIVVGVVAGYFRGLIGSVLMRIVDAALCFPTIFLLLALAAFIKPSVTAIVVLIAATTWMEVARIVEAQIRSLSERDFATAALSIGASDSRIMFKELLPNAMAPVVVSGTLTVAHAILAESYISFLGYGIQPPTPSWGNMLDSAQTYFESAPWLAILPGIMIALAVTSFNFIGDGLRDALDPKLGVR